MADQSSRPATKAGRLLSRFLPQGPPGTILGLYGFEIAAWMALFAAIVFLRSRGLSIDWVTFEYTVPPLILPTLKTLLAGVPIVALYTLVRRRSVWDYVRKIFTRSWLVLWARLWLVCLIFTYSYFWLKVSVPLVNWRLWDNHLWRLDSLFHLGFSPSVFLVELLGGTGLLRWIETWYGWWLPSMMFGLAFFAAYPDAETRRRFMLSTVLIWTLGPWLYLAVPALGPCYAYSEHWDDVRDELPVADGTQTMLWENYQRLIAGRTGPLRQFNPTRGIAALPSLHVGGHWLLMLWARRRARLLYVPAALGTLLTLVGSIVTGWHYALDGYAGIAIAQVSYMAAGALDRRLAPVRESAPRESTA